MCCGFNTELRNKSQLDDALESGIPHKSKEAGCLEKERKGRLLNDKKDPKTNLLSELY